MSKESLESDKSVVVIACMINLLAVSTVFMTQSIFLELSETFKIEITQARFSFSVVSLFYCISFFFAGPAADKFNLPQMALLGLIILAITVFCSSLTTNYTLFIVAMALTGLAAAMIPSAMFPHIAKTTPDDRIGVYMGAIVASGTLGVIFGRVSMGIMTAMAGWPISFRTISAILLFLALITYFCLVKRSAGRQRSKQSLGQLYMNSLKLLSCSKILALLLVGFSLFVGFLGMVTFLTYRLIAPPFTFSSGEIGWISFAGITALVAPFAGYLSQKIGQYRIIFISLVVCLLSLQLMGWFQSVPLIALGILLLFLGVYTCQPLVFILIARSAPKESIGSASALYALFCIGGGSLSSIILGPIWRLYGWFGVTHFCTISLLISLFILTIHVLRERGLDNAVDRS